MKERELEEKIAAYTTRHGGSALSIGCSIDPPALVIFISGALDTGMSSDLYTILSAAKELAAERGGLIIDLSGIHYVSSTGIGVFSTAMLDYSRNRIFFHLRHVPPKIRSLFELLGLWGYFSIIDGDKEPRP